MDYQATVAWLEAVPLYGKKDGLSGIKRLLDLLGRPQDQLRFIHVAGTNGKGSCCAMLSQILRENGYRVGLYTSPHLVAYTERIQIDGRPVVEEIWARLGQKVKETAESMQAAGENHPTFFELITAMAMFYFAEEKVDIVVLETGVGGRLDATNVISHPELCLITSISLDHTKVLGSSLPEIAKEKAGILKENVPVVLAENPSDVALVVKEQADKLNCSFFQVDTEAALIKNPDALAALALSGDYQRKNLAAVITAIELLEQAGWQLQRENILEGLRKVQWPGRMEEGYFSGKPLLLDGAHNPAGAEALAAYLTAHYKPGSCTLVFAALGKKDIAGVLIPLRECPAIGRAVFTTLEGEDNRGYFEAVWMNKEQDRKCFQAESPEAALQKAASLPETEQIVGAGSLYLVGEIKTIL